VSRLFLKPAPTVQASDVVTTTGGQSGNAAITLAHLGANVRYAGPLGAEDDAAASSVHVALMRGLRLPWPPSNARASPAPAVRRRERRWKTF
jgi:sugar/nucleoside kinase (ribokinase family)